MTAAELVMHEQNAHGSTRRERPILFSAPMVRALLADTKTQTRRVVKWRGVDAGLNLKFTGLKAHPYPDGWRLLSKGGAFDCWEDRTLATQCPYGKPGDRLWVREAFHHTPSEYEPMMSMTVPLVRAETAYRADYLGDSSGLGWKPSIHMPRALSRIDLDVTGVRVERLQEISEEDALAEGIQAMRCPDCHLAAYGLPGWGHEQLNPTAAGAYRYLWESINGPGSWGANPWVWAVSFKRIKP